jgi:diguanylate cyclase (GGDEF)-like protein
MPYMNSDPTTRPAPSRGRAGRKISSGLSGAGRVWILNFVIATSAVALYFGVVRHLDELKGFDVPFWMMVVAFFVVEVFVVHLEFRRNAHSVALGEIPLVMGLFFSTPGELVMAQLIGAGLALIIHRRQSPLKLVFNLSHFCLETCMAVIVFREIAYLYDPLSPAGLLGTFLATGLASVVGVLMVFAAISLSEGRAQFDNLPQAVGLGMIVTTANTSIGLIGVTILASNPVVAWLLLLPTVTLFLAYRAYMAERQKHSSLEFLYETTRVLQGSHQVESAMLTLLTRARSMFRAEMAEIVLFPTAEGEATLRTTLGPGDNMEILQAEKDTNDDLRSRITVQKKSLLLTPPIASEGLKNYMESRGLRDAMVCPLHGETRVIGAVLIGNRLGDVSTFDLEDLQLFETLANQTSVSLEKGRLEHSLQQLTELEEKLKHQAFHDSLTNLANRALFTDRVEHALARTDRTHDSLAVLFLDLDDFKTINDSLGHTAGDQLLIAVAERLRACLRPADTAARLGGDEFAVLLEDTPDLGDAIQVAERIIDALRSPFSLQGKEVFIYGSLGIAFSSNGREGASELLRNADVAMYKAKSLGKGRYELFKPSMHAAVLERMELKAELQRAVDHGEFAVHYQPLVYLENEQVAGVEALVRWQHPQRGLVTPEEFIALAEDTGLIVPLGRWVLEQACLRASEWQKRYPRTVPLTVNVNLSARQVQQQDLLDNVVHALETSKLAPENLVLEMTESVLVQDTPATIEKLKDLKQLGVRLAIDDFGTGYSSLSYLKQFPVDILKIDKHFIDGMGNGSDDTALARAIINLGEILHLQTVAEGIEAAGQRDELKALQCLMGQGYLFARPLDGDAVEAFLAVEEQDAEIRIPPETVTATR